MGSNKNDLTLQTNPRIVNKQERTVKPCSFIRVTEFMGGGSNDYLAVKGTDMLAQSYPPFLFKGLMRNVIAQNLLLPSRGQTCWPSPIRPSYSKD